MKQQRKKKTKDSQGQVTAPLRAATKITRRPSPKLGATAGAAQAISVTFSALWVSRVQVDIIARAAALRTISVPNEHALAVRISECQQCFAVRTLRRDNEFIVHFNNDVRGAELSFLPRSKWGGVHTIICMTIRFAPSGPDGPIPPVTPADLKVAWILLTAARSDPARSGQTAISASVIAGQCSPGADIMALFQRVAIIDALVRQGFLEPWMMNGEPTEFVFDQIATAPLSGQSNDVDAGQIIDLLERASEH